MQQKNFIQRITSKIKPGFWLYLTVYALVLVIAAMFFLIYTENSLNEYERSQSENVVARYSSTLKANALSGKLPEGLSVPALYKQFGLEDRFVSDYCAQFSKDTKMSVEKQKDSYDTTAPAFDIYADDVKVAELQLKAKNTKTVFAILSVSDWELVSFVPVVQAYDADSISITVLSTHRVLVNGVALDQSFVKQQAVSMTEFESFKQYVSAPMALTEYALPKALAQGTIAVQTEGGAAVSYTPDAEGNIYAGFVDYNTVVPNEYSATAMNIAKTWDNFLTYDLPGDGLATVRKYLIKGSAFYEQAEIFKNNDLWMTSSHNSANNVYKNVSIGAYTRYTENCFSCHIKFDKQMTLTRTGEKVYTYIDSIFYFINYDDTDDGVYNPEWKMVAMAGVAAS